MSNEARQSPSVGSSVSEDTSGSYRERFEERTLLLDTDRQEGMKTPRPDIEALRSLIERVDCTGTTYQSVAVAAVQILERALCYERDAAQAALSLGQQEKLNSMVETAEQAVTVLRNTLSAQGHKVMHVCTRQAPPDTPAEPSGQPWWFALTDALEVLEEGTDQMDSLTAGQPAESPARELSQIVAQLLRGHHDALLIEAEEWIS